VRIDPDACTDAVLLAAEVRRLQALVQSLCGEVREQRKEIAGLREERRSLLDADRPQPDRPEALATPEPVATPPEPAIPPAWLSRPYWVDPAGGHRYGFPRLYDPATDGDMTAWLIASGYPEHLARQELACTFTACAEDGEK
jgi:hypothetical protein